MKIGYGVITCGKRPVPNKLLEMTNHLHVETDYERTGVSRTRNRALKTLFEERDNDVVFLFDDDCYPTRQGWDEHYINFCQTYGVGFSGIYNPFDVIPRQKNQMILVPGLLGCFVMITRETFEKIGYYNTKYDRYGFEDAAYANRALRAKATGDANGFLVPPVGFAYIHSMDVFHENPTPNMSYEEKQDCIERNRPIFAEEVNSPELYYGYDQD